MLAFIFWLRISPRNALEIFGTTHPTVLSRVLSLQRPLIPEQITVITDNVEQTK